MVETITEIHETAENGWDGYDVVTSGQTIKLQVDNSSSCCESWGHFWSNDEPQSFIGAAVRDVTVTDTALNTEKVKAEGADSRDEGGIMFVNIETDRGTLQFVAYCSHNGYYGHTGRVVSTQRTESETL